jgi:uncharacterized phage protein (TIGR01671 family)
MREIEFRGKRLNDGQWVFGQLTTPHKNPNIWPSVSGAHLPTGYPVDPATIGQFTGLRDKNGAKIFEGDVLHHIWQSGGGETLETVSEVKFSNGSFIADDHKRADFILFLHVNKDWATVEVIGNVYDNPDLIP